METIKEKLIEWSKNKQIVRAAAIVGGIMLLLVVITCISILMRANIQRKYTRAAEVAQEQAYQSLIEMTELFARVDSRRAKTRPDTPGLIRAMEQQDAAGMARRMFNVFEDVLPRHCGEVAVIRGILLEEGALGSVMTGTGSAVFGVFADMAGAERAAKRLRGDYRDVFTARFINELEI